MDETISVFVDIKDSQDRRVKTKNTGELQINFNNTPRCDDKADDSSLSHDNEHAAGSNGNIDMNKTEKKKNSWKICNRFSKNGTCNKGDECMFRHVLKETTVTGAAEELPSKPLTEKLPSKPPTEKPPESLAGKPCRFFKSQMGCKYDDECSFQHYRGEADAGDESHIEQNEALPENMVNLNSKSDISKKDIHSSAQEATTNDKEKLGNENIVSSSNANPINTGDKTLSTSPRSFDNKLICKFFLSEQGCKRTNCRFIHVRKKGGSAPTSPIKEDIESQNDENGINSQQTAKRQIDFDGKSKNGSSNEQNSRNCTFFTTSKVPGDETLKTEDDQNIAENLDKNDQVVCKFFNTKRGCFKKLKCRNLHMEDVKAKTSNQSVNKSNTEVSQSKEKEGGDIDKKMEELQITNKKDGLKKQKRCRFFTKDQNCKQGDKCAFLHELPPTGSENLPPQGDEKSQEELRAIELQQLEKRWKGNFECLQKDPSSIYKVSITPTDPDWPFVIKLFDLHVEFPEKYPEKMFTLKLVDSDQYPPHFTGYMSEALCDWCTDRFKDHGAALHFRPFCKWFDKHLKQLFELSATKVKLQLQAEQAGIQLVHHRNIIQKSEQLESKNEQEEVEEDVIPKDNGGDKKTEGAEPDQNLLDTATGGFEDTNSMFTPDSSSSGSSVADNKCSDYVKKGTEIKLPNLQISDKIGTLRIRTCKVQLICERCKSKHDFKLDNKQASSKKCSKCSKTLHAVYYSELMHQYSPVAGYLHLQGCIAFDLILNDCIVVLNCIDCQRDNILRALTRGSKKNHWCQHCHVKMDLQIPSVKFLQLQPAFVGGKQTTKKTEIETKKKKVLKEPGIKEGQSLPDNGTCKHYKKSHRWLRFPCCGKAFPCDVCHEEGVGGDHEMKFANRMICGYCSKEQPFSKDKPCISCRSSVTKGHSTHWEGGEGCRDKSKMARGDKHKTAGLGKTISSKKKEDQKSNKK